MGDQAAESSKKRKRRKRNKDVSPDADEEHEIIDSGAADNSEEVAVKDEPKNNDAADDNNDDAAEEDEPTKKRKRKRNRKSKSATSDDKPDNTTPSSSSTTDTTTHTVFIEGLPFTSTPSDVRTFFETHGCSDILEMRLPTWQDSGRLRGFGHIVFGSLKTKERALSEVNRKELGGRYVSVLEAKAPRVGTTAGKYFGVLLFLRTLLYSFQLSICQLALDRLWHSWKSERAT
jgi:nucleolin